MNNNKLHFVRDRDKVSLIINHELLKQLWSKRYIQNAKSRNVWNRQN